MGDVRISERGIYAGSLFKAIIAKNEMYYQPAKYG